MSKERIALWDNTKFLLMILVVVGHFINRNLGSSHLYQSMYLFIWSFHMPLFIFVSGLFHKNRNIKEKVFSYFSIYFVLKICFFVLKFFTEGKAKLELFSEEGLPWFLFAMAVFTLITYLLRDIDKRYVLIIAIILGVFSGYDKNLGDFLVLSRIIVFYPFYFVGTMVSREKIEELAKKKWLKLLSALVIVAWGCICLFMTDKLYSIKPLLSARNAFGEAFYHTGYIYRIALYIIAGLISLCFVLVTPTFNLGVITKYGQRTLQVYFWHNLIIKLLVSVGMFEMFAGNEKLRLVWALLGVPLTFILSLDIFKFPVNLLMIKPKKENK